MILQTFIVDERATNSALSGAVEEQIKSGIAEADREKYGDLSKEEIEEQKKLERLLGLGQEGENSYGESPLVFSIDESGIAEKNTVLKDIHIPVQEIKAVFIDDVNKILDFSIMVVLVDGIQLECKYDEQKYLEICAYLETTEKVSIGSALLAKAQITEAISRSFGNSVPQPVNPEKGDKIVPVANMDTNNNQKEKIKKTKINKTLWQKNYLYLKVP